MQSEQINELAAALSKAQAQLDMARKEKINPVHRSKYADLAEIIKNARPILASNDLSISQTMRFRDGKNLMHTRLMHKSGQWVASEMEIGEPVQKYDKNKNPMENIQAIGSRITYVRRYQYAAILGTASSDEDDDAETAMQRHIEETQKSEQKIDQILNLNLDQVKEIQTLVGQDHELMNKILAAYKVSTPFMLKQKHFDGIIKRIKELQSQKQPQEKEAP